MRPEAPFTWSSGLRAPVYCDNRLTLAHPPLRRRIAEGFARIVRGEDWRPDLIAGTATAGIPHAAWLAERLDRPMAYVRSQAKGHGRENRIEGRVERGQRVVVIDDLISTGGSALSAVEALRQAGANVLAVAAIFSYGLDEARRRFSGADVPLRTLTDFSTLLKAAEAEDHLPPDALDALRAWRRDPEAWSAEQ